MYMFCQLHHIRKTFHYINIRWGVGRGITYEAFEHAGVENN